MARAARKTNVNAEEKKETTLKWTVPGLAVLAVKVWRTNKNAFKSGEYVAVKLAIGVKGGKKIIANFGGGTDPNSQNVDDFEQGLLKLDPRDRELRVILINYSTLDDDVSVDLTFAFDNATNTFQNYRFKLTFDGDGSHVLTKIPVKLIGV